MKTRGKETGGNGGRETTDPGIGSAEVDNFDGWKQTTKREDSSSCVRREPTVVALKSSGVVS